MTLKNALIFVSNRIGGTAHAIVLLLAATISAQTPAEPSSDTVVKTAFLYNFFKFIEWPETAVKPSAYLLCTSNNDQLGDSVLVINNKTINNKPMILRRNISGDDLKNCHMVFIGSSDDAAVIIHKLKGLPIVTVSDQTGFVEQGGMIGLVQDGNRLSFEVNLDAAKADGVHISAKLLKLAKRVNNAK